jgi:hypothetical protein
MVIVTNKKCKFQDTYLLLYITVLGGGVEGIDVGLKPSRQLGSTTISRSF